MTPRPAREGGHARHPPETARSGPHHGRPSAVVVHTRVALVAAEVLGEDAQFIGRGLAGQLVQPLLRRTLRLKAEGVLDHWDYKRVRRHENRHVQGSSWKIAINSQSCSQMHFSYSHIKDSIAFYSIFSSFLKKIIATP